MCKSLYMIDCFLMKSGFLMKSEAVGIYKLHHNVKTSVSFAHYLKQTFCIGKIKGTDKLRSHCEADHCLCFRYTDTGYFLNPEKVGNYFE